MNKERRREEKRTTSPSNSLSDLSYSDDSEEDWSVCSAKQCQQPEGNEVNWVQCDGSCNQWFHQICVGVSAEQAEKEDYICVNCSSDLTEWGPKSCFSKDSQKAPRFAQVKAPRMHQISSSYWIPTPLFPWCYCLLDRTVNKNLYDSAFCFVFLEISFYNILFLL